MDVDEFNGKVRAAYALLSSRLNIVRNVSNLSSLNVDAEFNEVALAPESTYKDIYLRAVSRSYYNIILRDFSALQFSWVSTDAWRLAYLPNPWITGVPGAELKVNEWEALEGLGLYDEVEIGLLISELPYYGSVPPIRFEYAQRQYRELAHPAAHMHIGRDTENRWPFSKLLTPFSFTLLLLKMYYVEHWAKHSIYYGGGAPCLDDMLISELERSRRVHDFSVSEARSLHLNAR